MLIDKLAIHLLLFNSISVFIFSVPLVAFSSVNCPCLNYATDSSCAKVFQNREFLCQSAVFRNEALKCAKTCQMCCERPEFKCTNKKDERTCQHWLDQGWCIEQQSVMATFCPNKCGLCNSITQQQNSECRNTDEKLCSELTSNECASENPMVRFKMYTKCPKLCGWC
ncbi:hypothetical protein niasHT_017039 [Heterodera trifolii]|uniref:ShKT domain-containing protein n=1 Tax=Heterodera trifolii TaxID=157864 RepID=A0ABD2KXX2_9BILA